MKKQVMKGSTNPEYGTKKTLGGKMKRISLIIGLIVLLSSVPLFGQDVTAEIIWSANTVAIPQNEITTVVLVEYQINNNSNSEDIITGLNFHFSFEDVELWGMSINLIENGNSYQIYDFNDYISYSHDADIDDITICPNSNIVIRLNLDVITTNGGDLDICLREIDSENAPYGSYWVNLRTHHIVNVDTENVTFEVVSHKEEIAHSGCGVLETFIEYEFMNNSSENEVTLKNILLQISFWPNLQLEDAAVIDEATGNYYPIDPLSFENSVDLEIVIPTLSSTIIGVQAFIEGNGNLGINLSQFTIEDNVGDIYIQNVICTWRNSTVVNTSEDMHYLRSSPEEEYYGNIYLFPGQSLHGYYYLGVRWDNSFNNTVHGFQFDFYAPLYDENFWYYTWYDYNLEELGLLTEYSDDYSYHSLWYSNSDTLGIDHTGLIGYSMQNYLPVGNWITLSAFLDIYNYHPSFGYIIEYYFQIRTISSNFGIKGDVDGDEEVDIEDLLVINDCFLTGNYWGTQYAPEGEINISRSNVLFNWVNVFNAWLINIWINDPNNELVADLGIGEPFTTESYSMNNATVLEYEISDYILTITETDADVIGVHGIFENRGEWSTVVMIEEDTLSIWTDQIEPEIILNRDDVIIIEIPDSLILNSIRVEGKILNTGTTDVEDNNLQNFKFELGNNYPNPFNLETAISFSIAKPGNVELTIYNIKGQRVKTLVNNETKIPGSYNVIWDGKDDSGKPVANGIYFYRLDTNKVSFTKKMILMK